MKDIIQNFDAKGHQKTSESDLGGGKKQALVFPYDLNTPYEGNINGEWLQQFTPFLATSQGEKVTRKASSSTWIPQCGESVFYSRNNHSKFIDGHINSLDEVQCALPEIRRGNSSHNDTSTQDHEHMKQSETIQNKDDFLKGTIVSVRTSFPKPVKNRNVESFPVVTPILIVELRLNCSLSAESIIVCWRPCHFSTLEASKCKACGLSQDSFLKPAWMPTDGTQITTTNSARIDIPLSLSKDIVNSIVRCFDFLKQRCIDGISPDSVNADVAFEKAENGVTANFDSRFLPSYPDFFSSSEIKYGIRWNKKTGNKTTLRTLSEAGYMPLWSLNTLQKHDGRNAPRYESLMPFPSLCLELVRLRISSGYYKSLSAVVNDITEAYIASVFFLLSDPSTHITDQISSRKIAKHLMSAKRNGKIAKIYVKKKSKKKRDSNETQTAKNQNIISKVTQWKGRKEVGFETFSEEEEIIIQQIIQIRKYHAAAIVFALESNHAEKIFCLAKTVESAQASDVIPDIDAIENAHIAPDQLEGITKIRSLLLAVGRELGRNRFKFVDRNTYKLKIKCGGQYFTENGRIETADKDSIMFQPRSIMVSLPDGAQTKLRIRCRNEYIHGDKKRVFDQLIARAPSAASNATTHLMPQIRNSKDSYHSTMVGRDSIMFTLADLKKNNELVQSLFGSPGRMHPCIRCQCIGESMLSCRVQKFHSNPDFDLVENFKGTSGVNSLFIPWKQGNEGMSVISNSETQDVQIMKVERKAITANSHETDKNLEELVSKETQAKELIAAVVKQLSAARRNFDNANKIYELATYLHSQAILLYDKEVKLSEEFISTTFPFDPKDNHYTFCIHCGCAGDLLVCDGCSNVSHPKCAGLEDVPEGDWFCHKCIAKKAIISAMDLNSDEINGETSRSGKQSNTETEGRAVGEKSEFSTTIEKGTNQCTDGEKEDEDDCCRKTNSSRAIEHQPGHSSAAAAAAAAENDTKTNQLEKDVHAAKTDAKPAENAATTVSTQKEELNQKPSQPEIDDDEFEHKESELDKLLTNLLDQRFEVKSNAKQNKEQKSSDEKNTRTSDPMEVLGGGYIRKFLSFIMIESAEQLFKTKSGLIAKDLVLWREEKGMKPLAGKGCISAVCLWKRMVRGAAGAEITLEDHPDCDNDDIEEYIPTIDFLQTLPPKGREFCSYIGITDAEVFLATESKELSKKYVAWRKEKKNPVKTKTGPSSCIANWKAKIRKKLSSVTETENSDPSLPSSESQNKNGFKVRKLFEDGNHYEGQVMSGPSKVLEEESGRMVLCWRVKYEDDDEEEFTLEELEFWGLDQQNEVESGAPNSKRFESRVAPQGNADETDGKTDTPPAGTVSRRRCVATEFVEADQHSVEMAVEREIKKERIPNKRRASRVENLEYCTPLPIKSGNYKGKNTAEAVAVDAAIETQEDDKSSVLPTSKTISRSDRNSLRRTPSAEEGDEKVLEQQNPLEPGRRRSVRGQSVEEASESANTTTTSSEKTTQIATCMETEKPTKRKRNTTSTNRAVRPKVSARN